MTDDHDDELPQDIVILPAERLEGEWRFNLATGIRPDGSGGPFEAGFSEADFRAALAGQGYDAAAVSLAVVEAVEAGELVPPSDESDEVPF